MSASDNSNVKLFRWEIVNMLKQRVRAGEEGLTSATFSLRNRPSVKFHMFIEFSSLSEQDTVRVILEQFDGKPFQANVKIWIESIIDRQKFTETFVEKHVFGKIGDYCGYNKLMGDVHEKFVGLYMKHKTFIICCEIVDLNTPKPLTVDFDQTFYQNQGALYEKEFHDSVVKIGKTEFKVLKMFFVAQSAVFEQMFLSNFKEGRTNTIEISDIEENTMKHFINWLYTNKLELDAPIEKLFYAADKYDIKLLKTTCVQLMIDSLSNENAFSRLVLACVHSNNDLKAASLKFISRLSSSNLVDMTQSEEWNNLSNNNPATTKEVNELISMSKMPASDNVTLFRWEVVDLYKQRINAGRNGLTSEIFSLQTCPSIQFAFSIQLDNFMREQDNVRIILKQFDDKPFETSMKLWVESVEGQKFGETFAEKHVFDKVGDFCGLKGISGSERKSFENLYFEGETFYICCELVDLNLLKTSTIECDQTFYQNQWALYEKEFHDSVVKIGVTEFKVLKMFFVAQSTVFERMFTYNFKEERTNTIEIKDIEENTMKHFIKWLYTNKLDSDAPIEKLFYAADKYDIKILQTICIQFMISSLSEENVFSCLVLAIVHNNNELKSVALEFINNLSKYKLVNMILSDECIQLNNKNKIVAKNVKELICNKLK